MTLLLVALDCEPAESPKAGGSPAVGVGEAFAVGAAEALVNGVAEALAVELAADGHRVALARSAPHARALAAMQERELELALAIVCCAGDAREALDLVREIRRGEGPWRADLPILLRARAGHPAALLRAFEAGADDFLRARDRASEDRAVDDLEYLELRARVGALLRRARRAQMPACVRIEIGPLSIDTAARAVALQGRPVALRPREYALLLALAREPTRVFTKEELLRSVWDLQVQVHTRTLDSHACRLRRKLGAASDERWIANVRSVGYRLR